MDVFGRRLVEAMAMRGMSVKQLYEKSGVARYTIYSYHNRDALPNASTLECLADALDVSMDWLYGRKS